MDVLVSVFLELVKISLTAGMIAGIILLIRAVIGKSSLSRMCYALWGVVLYGCCFRFHCQVLPVFSLPRSIPRNIRLSRISEPIRHPR